MQLVRLWTKAALLQCMFWFPLLCGQCLQCDSLMLSFHCCSVKFFWFPLSTVDPIWPIWEVTSTEGLRTNGDPPWQLCSVCILICLLFIVSVLWINVTGRILHFFLRWPASSGALWQSSEIQVQLEPPRSVAEYGSVCYVFKKWRGEVLLTFQFKAR